LKKSDCSGSIPSAAELRQHVSLNNDIFVGRQPIYNRELEVVAYELLFRSGEQETAVFSDHEQATAEVLANTFLEIGLQRIVGHAQAFLNVSRDFILGNYPLPPTQGRIALEILEDQQVDDQLLAAVRDLVRRNYTIVLDDFVYHESLQPLVDMAHIVKIDVLALDRDAVREHVAKLRQYNVELLAEKIETPEDFEFCEELGFDYYQGFFFCKPNVVRGTRAPVTQLAVTQLLAVVQNPAVEFEELEQTISHDATLSFKVLRLINSAFYSLPKKVESIRQALVLLGLRTIRNWVSLIVMTRVENKPRELLITALVRARMCELLAQSLNRADADTFFMVGLFSVLDALLDRPMEDVVKQLPLASEVNAALLHHEGDFGRLLDCVLAYERGDWERISCPGLGHRTIADAYLDAVAWGDEVGGKLAA
jgi:EAL and modified HD-GYP domain-containing signal transduction protein